VEPGLAQTVPRVGVLCVPIDQPLVEPARLPVLALEEGAVGVDDRAVVLGQVGGVRRRPDDGSIRHRVLFAYQPAAGERELVVGQTEGRVERHGAIEVALRAGEIPPVEPVYTREIAAVRLE
jgi:hypothetical protein